MCPHIVGMFSRTRNEFSFIVKADRYQMKSDACSRPRLDREWLRQLSFRFPEDDRHRAGGQPREKAKDVSKQYEMCTPGTAHSGISTMTGDLSELLQQLPQELRDEIYKHILLEEEEVRPAHPSSPRYLDVVSVPRAQARLLGTGFENGSAVLSAPVPFCQLNQRLRIEASQYLESSKLPIVTRVRNFDFDHLIRYFTVPESNRRLQSHAVREDGTIPRRLIIEFTGPYNTHWRANLLRWIKYLDERLPANAPEFGALHKTVFWDGRGSTRTPPKIVQEVQQMYHGWPVGAGRQELYKVSIMLYARWRREGPWVWVDDGTGGWEIERWNGLE